MNYDIYLGPNGAYVGCKIMKPVPRELVRELTLELRNFGFEHKLTRFLLDARTVRNTESRPENYLSVRKDLSEFEPNPGNRVAVLITPGDRTHDLMHNALRGAGINLLPFEDEAEAVAWLTS